MGRHHALDDRPAPELEQRLRTRRPCACSCRRPGTTPVTFTSGLCRTTTAPCRMILGGSTVMSRHCRRRRRRRSGPPSSTRSRRSAKYAHDRIGRRGRLDAEGFALGAVTGSPSVAARGRARDGMGRDADAERARPRRHVRRYDRARRQDERERPGPVAVHQRARRSWRRGRRSRPYATGVDQDEQRLGVRPPLQREEALDGRRIERGRGQAVERLGRKRHGVRRRAERPPPLEARAGAGATGSTGTTRGRSRHVPDFGAPPATSSEPRRGAPAPRPRRRAARR